VSAQLNKTRQKPLSCPGYKKNSHLQNRRLFFLVQGFNKGRENGSSSHQASMIIAIPIPPPMHMEIRPVDACFCFIRFRQVTI